MPNLSQTEWTLLIAAMAVTAYLMRDRITALIKPTGTKTDAQPTGVADPLDTVVRILVDDAERRKMAVLKSQVVGAVADYLEHQSPKEIVTQTRQAPQATGTPEAPK